jgi:mRNA degradation ribonuclease J1/J2
MAASGDEMAEIDVGHIGLRDRKRLSERGHAALQVRVTGRVDLAFLCELADAPKLVDVLD